MFNTPINTKWLQSMRALQFTIHSLLQPMVNLPMKLWQTIDIIY